MTLEMARLVADEVRKVHRHLTTRIVQVDGKYIVKVNDGEELVMKFDGSNNGN